MGGGGSKTESKKVKSTKSSRRKKHGRAILILGTAGVGKTTIIKQLTMSLGDGLSLQKKNALRDALRLHCVKYVVDTAHNVDDSESEVRAANLPAKETNGSNEVDWLYTKLEAIEMWDPDTTTSEETAALGVDLASIWGSDVVQKMQKTRRNMPVDSESQLSYACAEIFMPEVKRVFAADFTLTDREALHVRLPTQSIEITDFKYKKEEWSVQDVGGQLHMRELWKTAFADVNVVLFIVSLADYDNFNGSKNRLMESRQIFKEICGEQSLFKKPVVLLFNKIDIFEKKLLDTSFSVCPQFKKLEKQSTETNSQYMERCCYQLFKYFRKAYIDVLNEGEKGNGKISNDDAPIEYYTTTATDENFVESSMTRVFASLSKALQNALTDAGVY